MASEVDICNLALGNLGDRATVASIDPPEGSAQAEHCARFYPIARDSLLEMHQWGFATKQVALAEFATPVVGWDHSYAQPSDLLKPIEILTSSTLGSPSTFSQSIGGVVSPCINEWEAWNLNRQVDFSLEADSSGARIIYTNQASAWMRYIARVDDTMKFTPLFVEALSWKLASMLAGPIIKGDAGAAESKRCMQMMQSVLGEARRTDSQGHKVKPHHAVGWMAGR